MPLSLSLPPLVLGITRSFLSPLLLFFVSLLVCCLALFSLPFPFPSFPFLSLPFPFPFPSLPLAFPFPPSLPSLPFFPLGRLFPVFSCWGRGRVCPPYYVHYWPR